MKHFLTLLTALGLLSINSNAQLLKNAIKKVVDKTGNDVVSNVLNGPQPISTAFKDVPHYQNIDSAAQWDGFTPREPQRSIATLQRTPNGGFVLQPGYYSYQGQSYCLHAGTHGPSSGDGYMYAPPLGTAVDEVESILRNSVNHPDINQHDIQLLLWAIVARAKFENLDNNLKAVAARLLTPRQLAGLNRNALDLVPGPALEKVKEAVPEPVKMILDAEAQLRQMLTTPGSSYEQMERVAVLTGVLPASNDAVNVPSGRWSIYPDGYYIRYIPQAYYSTRVEIWVPQGSAAVGKEFDPATHIATPANTGRQRLIQSGRFRQEQ